MNDTAGRARSGRPRRAVRPSGTVGTDETVLRSVLPAAVPAPHAPHGPGASAPAVTTGAGAAETPPALPVRSLDDGDLGWGGVPDESNDERLRQDVPPHW